MSGRFTRIRSRWTRLSSVIAGVVLADVLLFGFALVTPMVLAVGAILTVLDMVRQRSVSDHASRLLVFLLAYALVFPGIFLGQWYGERQARPVIQALTRFHDEKLRYPSRLEELVPVYLEGIPRPTLRLFIDTRFRYRPSISPGPDAESQFPRLEWTWAPPFGRCWYDLATRRFSCLG